MDSSILPSLHSSTDGRNSPIGTSAAGPGQACPFGALLMIQTAPVQMYYAKCNYEWHTDQQALSIVHGATHVTSGKQFNNALRVVLDGRNKKYHPIGVHCLEWRKISDNEGRLCAYLHFKSAPFFGQWLATKGTCAKQGAVGSFSVGFANILKHCR